MPSESKKTLVVSSYAPPAIGGPQNLYNLLKDYPTDSYCILTSFYNIDNLSAQKGTWLKGEYVFYDKPGATKDTLKERAASDHKAEVGRSIITKLKHLVKRIAFVRALAGIPVIIGQSMVIIRQGRKAVKERGIDALLGFSDYGPALIATYFISKLTKKPFSIFLFDIYKGGFYPFPGGLMASIFEPALFKRAEYIVVTNRGTKEFYQKRYGQKMAKKIVVIYNATFPEPYLKLQTPYDPKPPYTILFTGRIYWPQIGSLKNLIKAVEEIGDLDIKLKLYCPNPRDYLEKIGIKEGGKIELDVAPPREIPSIQSKADILFLPLSWNTRSQAIIDTATPGKLTDYLVAGRPMLIHAPASSHLVQYAKENQFAAVVDDDNVDKLKTAIRKLFQDKAYAKQLIENAQKTFFKNHDVHRNAKLFKVTFLSPLDDR